MDDPTNIVGISKLVNQSHVNSDINIDELEKKIIGNELQLVKKKDPEAEFNKKMKKIQENLTSRSRSSSSDSSSGSYLGDDSFEESSDSSESTSHSETPGNFAPASARFRPVDKPKRSLYSVPAPSAYQPYTPGNFQPPQQSQIPQISQISQPSQPSQSSQSSRQFQQQQQQQSGNYIDYAASSYTQNADSSDFMSREDEEEKKTLMLDDIDYLRTELKDEDNADLSRIPEVTPDSTFSEIENVLKALRRKYDRLRNNSFGNEMIIASAQALEFVFDGEKKIGNHTVPDLTGWHNTIRVKLRRMKYETSTIVSETMEKMNVGPLGRLLMELGPSAILHSKMRSDQHGKKTYTRDQMAKAHEDLREFDD